MFEDPKRTKKYLKIAVFGKGGTGKTRLALSFPKPAVIDSERGTDPYVEKYDFKVFRANRWKQLAPTIKWLKDHPGVYETLVIDSATVFYGDLINDIVEVIKAKRGNEMMTKGDWGIEKRKFAAFLNYLIELPMHIVLCFRGKDEYVDVTNRSGEEVMKKTGEEYPEADKQVEFLFDLAFRCYTEEDKKGKTSRYFVACTKSRYDWMPKYSVHDLTKKWAFDALFAKQVNQMLSAPEAEASALSAAEMVEEVAAPESAKPATQKQEEQLSEAIPVIASDKRVEELKGHFGVETKEETGENLVGPGDEYGVPATVEEIKVLMTRAKQLSWPDGSPFTSAQGKRMIQELYGVESTKELKRFQVDFLTREFGDVLAGRSILVLEEGGIPIITKKEVAVTK